MHEAASRGDVEAILRIGEQVGAGLATRQQPTICKPTFSSTCVRAATRATAIVHTLVGTGPAHSILCLLCLLRLPRLLPAG